jgi:multiple sugar transport system substrate-binding protein
MTLPGDCIAGGGKIKVKIRIIQFSLLLMFWLLPIIVGCSPSREGMRDGTVIVFKHGKIAGNPEPFRRLLTRFERENPGIKVKDETLPASTDEQHQFYVINLEGKSADFDVLSMDVIWVQEFARAGWLEEVSHLLAPGEENAFFPGPMQAVTYEGKPYAIPWYIDAGLLYYRKDVLKRYGRRVPRTWQELVDTAKYITERERQLYGFIWQGKQYEGLVCNVLEYFWSNGGGVLRDGRVVIDSQQNREALAFVRDLIAKYGVTPPLVTTSTEETTRRLFGSGKALFMRNWPYAYDIFQRTDSSVRGKAGVAALPSFPGGRPASTLGGWQLGINRFSHNREAAEKFVQFLTSPSAQKELARTVGYKPTRKSLYKDPDLLREQPFITSLYGIFLEARPRPVTPYYMMITQVMQPEFSSVVSGIKKAEDALGSAQKQIEHILTGDMAR